MPQNENNIMNPSQQEGALPTLKEMVRDRGFVKLSPVTPTEQNLGCVLKGANLARELCYVHVVREDKLGIKMLRNIVKRYDGAPKPKIIVVCKEGATSFTAKSIAEGGMEDDVCVFKTIEVARNITRHSYVPEHRRCGQTEVADIMRRLGLESTAELPKLSVRDPVARYYKFAPGEVISVHRKGCAHEPHEYYRVITRE